MICEICKDHGKNECPWHCDTPIGIKIKSIALLWIVFYIASQVSVLFGCAE